MFNEKNARAALEFHVAAASAERAALASSVPVRLAAGGNGQREAWSRHELLQTCHGPLSPSPRKADGVPSGAGATEIAIEVQITTGETLPVDDPVLPSKKTVYRGAGSFHAVVMDWRTGKRPRALAVSAAESPALKWPSHTPGKAPPRSSARRRATPMPQPAGAVSPSEYWTFLCAAALLAITFAVPRNFGGGGKLSRRPATGAFGTTRSSASRRAWITRALTSRVVDDAQKRRGKSRGAAGKTSCGAPTSRSARTACWRSLPG